MSGIRIQPNLVRNGTHFNGENYNYNFGIVGLEVRVEPYCPFTADGKQTFNILLNDTTVQKGGFSEEQKKNISSVPGLDGIYLKEKHIYLSNYLLDDGQPIPGSDDATNPAYKSWQTWSIVDHPLVKPPEGLDNDSLDPECSANFPNWKMRKVNFQNTVEGNRFIGSPDVQAVPQEEDGEIPRIDAAQDANIFSPTQTAVSTPVTSVTATDCKHGVHWRVEKDLPLFMGQDFFIEFHNTAVSTDNSNFELIKEFQNENTNLDIYKAINSNFEYPGTEGSFSSAVPPANQGVRTYQAQVNKSSNRIEGWTSDPKSSAYFDMNRQAYYIVELGSDLTDLKVPDDSQNLAKEAKYFIFITQNWRPTFIKVAKPVNGEEYVSYNLGTYNGLHGSDLIDKRDQFRMTLRNHLGKIVITFDGKEDNPWIIQAPDLLTVPEGKISIWGGNISAGFIFSPLTYNQATTMLLPPGVEDSCTGYQFSSINRTFGINDIGYELNIGRVGSSGRDRRISSSSTETEISSGYIYSCNSQALVEKRVRETSASRVTVNDQDGPNYLGLRGGVNTQLTAPTFSANARDKYSISGNFPTNPLSSNGSISRRTGNIKSAIGLKIDGGVENDILEWATDVNLVAGAHSFQKEDEEEWLLEGCKTPIVTSITFSLRDKTDRLWAPLTSRNRIDHRVMSFNDQWTAQDYYKIDHTGSMTIYLNQYDADPASPAPGEEIDPSYGSSSQYMLLEDIKKLQKRQFYITVDAIYDPCTDEDGGKSQYFQRLGGNSGKKERLFTGIAKDAVVKQRAGVATMDVSLVDYFDVLQGKVFFNSPFFDGVRDINAVYEILRIAGFATNYDFPNQSIGSTGGGQSPGPAWLLHQASLGDGVFEGSFDDFKVKMAPYALPQSYNRLLEPYFKPEDGSNLYDIIYEFAKRANKMMYFDRFGVFHYENRPFDDQIFNVNSGSATDVYPVWAWTAIPWGTLSAKQHKFSQVGSSKFYRNALLVENEVSIQFDVSSCYNDFKVITSTPNRDILIGSDVDYSKFEGSFTQRQNRQGWLGYRRPLYQAEGIFGGEQALVNTIRNYSKIKNPPIVVQFEAKGLPVKALDIGVLHMFQYNINSNSDAILFPFIITNVSSSIDPKQNTWQQSIEGEWIQSAQGDIFL